MISVTTPTVENGVIVEYKGIVTGQVVNGVNFIFLKEGLKKKGYQFFIDSPTNQQFVVLENSRMEELKKDVQFGFWEKADDSHTVVRFATSWATRMEDVQKLLSLL